MSEGRQVLDLLLRERNPEERERLARAWERFAGGDPDSLPALYALADRFSLEAHAALLAEMKAMHEGTGLMAREIGDGAGTTVKRTEEAAARSGECVDQMKLIVDQFESEAKSRREDAASELRSITRASENASRELAATGKKLARANRGRSLWVVCVAALAVGSAGGWFIGGEARVRIERERIGAMIDRWEAGDGKAYREIMAYLENYRGGNADEAR